MASKKIPGVMGGSPHPVIDAGTMSRTASHTPGPVGTGATRPDSSDPYLQELQELGLDLIQMAFDVAGIFDPTPISDGASGLMALARGQWLDAVISGASMIPYVGDLAKAGKLPKYLKSLERAIELARKSAKAADALLPGLRKLKNALDLIPSGANKQIDKMRKVVTEFLQSHAAKEAVERLPDISKRFKFPHIRTVIRNGKEFRVKEASGRLGIPGKVKSHRQASEKLQKKVSSGSGDDAGHLIGDQFGAPPGTQNLSKADAPLHAENLSRQNWIQNEGGGTYHDLESRWSEQLQQGTGIEVRVRDYFPEGSNRPSFRTVEWTEIAPDGTKSQKQLDFMNTHTPDAPHRDGSRTKTNQPPSVAEPQQNNVIDTTNRPATQHWHNRAADEK